MSYQGISIKDKVIIVVGGTGGIGSALVNGLAKEGAVVVPTSRSLDRVKETVEKIEALGGCLSCLYGGYHFRGKYRKARLISG